MIKNRYLNTQDHRRGMRDGRGDMGEQHEKFSRFNQYLDRQRDMAVSMDRGMDSRRDMRDMVSHPMSHNSNNMDYNYGYDRAYDMGYSRYDSRSDYGYDGHQSKISEEQYFDDIDRWTEKLKRKDRFKTVKKEEIINQAKQMGVRFEDFTEEEFYAVYLMHISDYKNVANGHRMYISMAKDWLEDDDIEVSPSEKLCLYYYTIVKGKPIK